MARGRRSRRRNRRQQHQAVSTEYGEQFNDEEGSRKPEPGTELVDEETLVALREQVEPGQFKESGFKCDRCNYVTKRKGLSGIQGLRSHTRIHVRNRRAAYRPMKIQAAVLLASLCIALLPLFIDTTVLLPVPALPELAGWHGPLVVTAAPAVVAAYTWFVGVRFVNSGRRKLVTRIELGVLAGDVLLVAVAATWTYAAAAGIHWPWLLGVAVPPVLSGLLVSPEKNIVLLAVQRREFRPGGYRKLLKAKTEEGDDQLQAYRYRMIRMIRDGRLVVSKLSGRERELLERLHLTKITPDPKVIQQRLQKEARKKRPPEVGRPRRSRKPPDTGAAPTPVRRSPITAGPMQHR